MPLYLYRWPNSDLSVVYARDRLHAADLLDQWGNADPERLITVPLSDGGTDWGLAIDFTLNKRGKFDLNPETGMGGNGFSEEFYAGRLGRTIERLYPRLTAAEREIGDELDNPYRYWSRETKDKVAAAVAAEDQRDEYQKPGPTGDADVDRIASAIDMHPALVATLPRRRALRSSNGSAKPPRR